MSYFEALGLKKEPFSISPDPAFFYRSTAHVSALQRLEITIRLRRGLSLVLGDVGTGKTTLGRVLVQNFNEDPDFEFHLVLNPLYQSEFQFLEALCKMFLVPSAPKSTMDCLEALQNCLYQRGVGENKTTILAIDEGQNLTPTVLEVLRSLLNYETNEHKLLQVVILAQLEALPRFQRIRNFIDRVSMKYVMNPFDEGETRSMIRFRLQAAGSPSDRHLLTDDAVKAIYEATHGYPRRINFLCQRVLEAMVMHSRKVGDSDLVRRVAAEEMVSEK